MLFVGWRTIIHRWGCPQCSTRHDHMNQNLIQLSQQYATALEKHLKQGPQAGLLPALKLGRRAVTIGLETLDLARIHEQALVTLQLSNTKNAFTKLAGLFFTEANTAIEETHRAACQTKADLSKLMAALGRRTQELAASNRQLQKGAARRKVMEDDFAERGKHHQKRLEESLELQNRLRHLTHQVLVAQEDERKKISRELQDEIAQTLLGINVRLLNLKGEARRKTNGLNNKIANTQRLVSKSVKSVRLAGRRIGGL
jgi:two-component system, NarL family, sensor histidine kinase DegS